MGTKFFVQRYTLDAFTKHQLIELGIIPSTPVEIMQKNFSFVIIKCRGARYALAKYIARQLMVCKA